MRHFHLPFVTRKNHDEEIRKLNRTIDDLKQQLSFANAEVEKFKEAQTGGCVATARCNSCKHCLEHIVMYGIGRYERHTCDLTLPQCKQYSPKE